MLDIRKEELYIKDIIRAVVSRLPRRSIPMDRPRINDAFLYTISGSCRFKLDNGESFDVRPGDVVYLARGVDYAMEILTDEYRYIPCVFLFDTDQPCRSMRIRHEDPAVLDSLFHKLAKNRSITDPGQKQICMALLYQICAVIVQNEGRGGVAGSARLRIEKLRTYIQSHIAEPYLKVAKLAEMAEMSEVHLRKLFVKLYQVTPSVYILHARVNYAKELMSLKELRLEDVAMQSGFSSLAHMCKVFKAVVGVSPGVYRANLKL